MVIHKKHWMLQRRSFIGNIILIFLFVGVIWLVAGCTSSTLTPNTQNHSTPTSATNIWNNLEHRPLRIPTLAAGKPCPTTNEHLLPYFGLAPGSDIVFPSLTEIPFADAQTFAQGNPHNNGWGGQKVLWIIQKSYQGPVLIRGHQIGGSHVLHFNGGIVQSDFPSELFNAPQLTELRLMNSTQYGSPYGWPTYTRIQTPGCYIYQIDGTNFSGYVIFQAVFTHYTFPTPTP